MEMSGQIWVPADLFSLGNAPLRLIKYEADLCKKLYYEFIDEK
jgi:hypothetical protein